MTAAGAVKSAMPFESSLPRLSDREFSEIRNFIHRETGISLSEAKRALVVARLSRRLRELALPTFSDYFRRIAQGDDSERTRMIDCICTNETHFFRDARQFSFLESALIPSWIEEAKCGRRERKIVVWSAGCSTGEEPYSLAMVLLHALPPTSGWSIEIRATDLSRRALASARLGTWSSERAKEIPTPYLKSFMLRGVGSQKGVMKAGPEIRSVVFFDHVNLVGSLSELPGSFDLILCRNVMIYFDGDTKKKVVGRLLDRLAPSGYLFLGHAESLSGLTDRAKSIGPTAYRLSDIGATTLRSLP